MKFSFIAKHPGTWLAGWLCGALGVLPGWLLRVVNTTAQSAQPER